MFFRPVLASALAVTLTVAGSPATARSPVRDLHDVSKAALVALDRVDAAGDVNGDGTPDVLAADCSEGDRAGATYVVFGPFGAEERIELADLGDRGFAIHGDQPDDFACLPTAAGDVNGDGLEDILVGANRAGMQGRNLSGRAYVVFGKTGSEPVELADFDQNQQGASGYRIDGPSERAMAGERLDGVGDVNGDGLDDVAVAAPFAGAVYIVYGKTDPLPVDLLTFDLDEQMGQGYRVVTGAPSRNTGLTVSRAGDVNGDGAADVVVGYIPRLSSTGAAFVVFGAENSQDLEVHDLGSRGFEIKGTERRSSTGDEVSDIGDVNGDGLGDIAIGAPYRYCCGQGKVFVVYGKKSTARLKTADLGRHGYTVRAARNDDDTGFSVDGAGDINDDGLPDYLVGVGGSSLGGGKWTGSVYVIYGGGHTGDIDLPRVGSHGYRVDGTQNSDFFGFGVAGPGDVTEDDIPDILSGVHRNSGIGFVVWGERFDASQ